jgi:FtsH-binding integral membrane protein
VSLLDISHWQCFSESPLGVDYYVDNKPSLCFLCAATFLVTLFVIQINLAPQSAPLALILLTAFATCLGALLLLALLTY